MNGNRVYLIDGLDETSQAPHSSLRKYFENHGEKVVFTVLSLPSLAFSY
jgi:hypothetical protein